MIPYSVFKKSIKDLLRFWEELDELGESMELLGHVEVTFGMNLFESYVDLLSQLFGTELIDNWVFENDFGRKTGQSMKQLYKEIKNERPSSSKYVGFS